MVVEFDEDDFIAITITIAILWIRRSFLYGQHGVSISVCLWVGIMMIKGSMSNLDEHAGRAKG